MKTFVQFKFWHLALLFAFIAKGAAAPVINADSYTVTEDTALVQALPGVLANDIGDPVGDTLNASIVTPPTHGTVTLQADGSFNYTPTANYTGADAFTYLAQGSRMFTVDRTRSTMNVKATGTIALGTSSDNKNGNMIGSAKVYLNPAAPPSQQIQVQDLDLTLDSKITLQLKWLFGTVTLNAEIDPTRTPDPDFLMVNMDQPGPVAPVAGDGTFTQPGNTLTTTGRARLSGNVPGVTIPPSLDINSTAPYDIATIPGEAALGSPSITVVGSNLELRIPMKVTQTLVDPNYTIVVEVKGVVIATAPVNPLPGSGTATVSLTILPVNDEPSVANDKFYTRQNFPLSIPATAATTTQSLIDAGGVWKWSTGADLGTSWRTWNYNDTSWAFGGAQLGYGDSDEVTLVEDNPTPGYSNSPAPTDRYPTAYFRKEFTLASPFDTVQAQFEILRDDAAVIYLNGTEIYRDSDPYTTGGPAPLPAAPATITYATLSTATIPDEATFRTTASGGAVLSFSRSLLLEGRNVIAAEVHQTGSAGVVNSSDMSFDFKLKRTRGVAGLIANDTDVDGDTLGAQLFIAPAHGIASVQPNGAFIYTPAPGFHGTDTFTYRVTEGGIPATREVVIVKPGSESAVGAEPMWQYLDNGVDPGSTWKDPSYDDAAWPVGPAELGYGDGDERRVIEDNPTPGYSNSPVPTDRYITAYFRKSVTLTDITKLSALRIRLKRDDGAAVYLNGTKVMLSNLSDSAGHSTLASASIGGADENLFIEQMVTNLSMLQEGTNTLAVEVHQSAQDSSDLTFDLGLSAIYAVTGQVTMEVLDDDIDNDLVSDTWERSFGLDTTVANADVDTDKDGQTNRAEFLAGTNPLSNASVFRVGTSMQLNPTTLQFEFDSVPGKTYQMEVLAEGVGWQNQGSPFPAHATNPRTSVQLTKPATARKMYRFRVVGDWQ